MTNEPRPPAAPVSGWKKLGAFLRQRCPRCRQGKLFRGQFTMNDPCPVCGLVFQREEGYFLGSMYFSYMFGTLFIGTSYFVGSWLFPDTSDYVILAPIVGMYFLLIPMVFRWSRTAWIHFDRWDCLSDTSAGAYEKAAIAESHGPSA